MNKILAISFVMLFLLYAMGIQLFSQSSTWLNRMQIHRSKRLETHQVIVLSKTQFQKLKIEGQEFFFEGNRYDLFSIDSSNNEMLISCFHDTKEEWITKRLCNFIDQLATHNSTDSPKRLINENLFKYFLASTTKQEGLFEFHDLTKFRLSITPKVGIAKMPILSPPPES